MLRNLNQDPLENFFSSVRAHGYRNISPTVQAFVGSYKALLINNLLSPHSVEANCESDNSFPLLSNVKQLFRIAEVTQETEVEASTTCEPSQEQNIVTVSTLLHKQTAAYVAGWVAHKILYQNNCPQCIKSLTMQQNDRIHDLVTARQFCKNKNNLKYATAGLIGTFNVIENIFHKNMSNVCNQKNVRQSLINLIEPYLFLRWIVCDDHVDVISKKILNISVNLLIHN